jgi:hypothetical protein
MKTHILYPHTYPEGLPDLSGYPDYPEDEDIYVNATELEDVDPEDLFRNKASLHGNNHWNVSVDHEVMTGDDLDIPGMGDEREEDEDEENSYYSLGGDTYD